jgi:hypothetical protein
MAVKKLKVKKLEAQESEFQGSWLDGVLGRYLVALGWWRRLG